MRPALAGLRRYIATVETSRRRFFVFLDAAILPDNKLVNIALDDAYFLGVLSSRIHVTWALAAGSHLGVGNDPVYVKTACFEKFPFPAATDAQQARIRAIAEELDSHRKRQQAQHPKLTLTDMYNVLEKLRAGEPLSAAEKVVHEQGLVSVLRQLHDELDAAVFDAYGWPAPSTGSGCALTDEEILERLVALNAERAAEEAQGLIRWLRPEYQAPTHHAYAYHAAGLIQETAPGGSATRCACPSSPGPTAWPSRPRPCAARWRAWPVRRARPRLPRRSPPRQPDRVAELLETLVTLGQARQTAEGRFVG